MVDLGAEEIERGSQELETGKRHEVAQCLEGEPLSLRALTVPWGRTLAMLQAMTKANTC